MKKIYLSLMLLVAVLAPAQNVQQPPPQKPVPPSRVELEEPQKERKITPAEAKELFKSVDEILQFASQDTLLPVRSQVKKSITSRAQVEKYIEDKFQSDVDRKRFERSELILKKFGLLPRKFDLHTFLVKLLGEQVAGYYDEKTKTMNLLDWIEPGTQKSVMAHELTHALQDQSYDLDKMNKQDEEVEKRGLKDLDLVIKTDEASTCRSAVLEGQAMIVLLDYLLAPSGRSVETAPQFVDIMLAGMDKRDGSPLYDSAPLLLQEELIFPYRDGMKFIQQLLKSGGKKQAYAGVLGNLPQTTREIMEPQEYLAGRRVPPLLLPDLSFLKKSYEAYDAGAVGEFDVDILLRQYADAAIAGRLTPQWRGGAYYAAGRRKVKPADHDSTAHIGLLYISKWASDAAAKDFAQVYSSALVMRYNQLQQLPGRTPGREKYSSTDGPIVIQQTGDVVVAVESFDESTAEQLIAAALKQGQPEPKPAVAQATPTQR